MATKCEGFSICEGVSITFFSAAIKALSRQYGERAMAAPLSEMVVPLAEAERLYKLLPEIQTKSRKGAKAQSKKQDDT